MKYNNIVEILKNNAINNSELLAYCMVSNNNITESVTYKELDEKARSVASFLQSKNLKNERIIIALPQGLDFITAFFGCMYAGVIVVPSYPPFNQKQTSRIKAVANDSQARFIIANSKVISLFDTSEDDLSKNNFEFIKIDQINNDSKEYQDVDINIDDIAFLQYTSGSTGLPKGVIINHENIMTNISMLDEIFGHNKTSKDIFGGWLPLFHDMGLVAMVLRPIYHATTSYIMNPVEFIKNPLSWLEMISKYKLTDTGGPNFAYDACVNEIPDEKIKDLDLSSWKIAFNGAEPVRENTINNFINKFKSTGLKNESIKPCYGMAEVTLFISGDKRGDLTTFESISIEEFEKGNAINDDSSDSKIMVSSGIIPSGEIVKIVNPNNLACCSSSQIGEIWVSGKHIAKGYWNKPDLTDNTFNAFTSDTNEGPFLRTGDLGFLRDDGKLFITGRLKDLIIIRGKNYAPQDIEFVVENSSEEIKHNCSAAFSIDLNNEEVLIVVAEIEKKYADTIDINQLTSLIHRKISSECGLNLFDIVFIHSNTIPRTTSGKIQRKECSRFYQSGKLKRLDESHIKSL